MANPQNFGAFVPTTNVWDVAQLYSIDVTSPEFKELLVRLYQNINQISLVLNIKDSAYYPLSEFVNGQLFFPDQSLDSSTSPYQTPEYRQVFRKVINFGALPNAGVASVPHDIVITPTTTFTRIYGTASDPGTSFIPLPYASATGDNIELNVDVNNVNIITASDRTNYTISYVVLEYLKF